MTNAPPNRLKVFLVDDHAVVRAGIKLLLESRGIEVVGEAASGEHALMEVPSLEPDIVVCDLTLPGLSGIETTRALHSKLAGKTRFIALSMHEEPEYVQGFLEAGGSGYVPKSAVETQLLDALSAVARGEYYAPAKLLAELAKEMAGPDPYRNAKLTKRELEVVKAIAEGRTYKEIATLLSISEKTVATYRERAAQKLGLKTRADLVRWALEQNVLS